MTCRIAHLLFFLVLLSPLRLGAQVDEAKEAIGRGEFVRAVTILSQAVTQNPTADAYLYLGIAYGNMRDYNQAEATLKEGAVRYVRDPRFQNELAGVYLARNQTDAAKGALHSALAIDPENKYASDLLAVIAMSQGEIRGALASWNRSGRPVIKEILHNGYSSPGHWTVRKAPTFGAGDVLVYEDWRTTARRLTTANVFTSVGMEIEPTADRDRYNIDIRATSKTNSRRDLLFDIFKGLPVFTTYLDLWNLHNSGLSLNSSYRFNPKRRRASFTIQAPIPLPGLLFLEASAKWRSEQWDIWRVARLQDSRNRFRAKSTGGRLMVRHIPNSWLDIGGGFEYLNRAGADGRTELAIDGRNSGKLLLETSIYLFQDQVRLRSEGFLARKSIMGDFNYSGGTLEANGRFRLSEENNLMGLVTLKGGTSRGSLPLEDYFSLGVDTHSNNLLRGHSLSGGGFYGAAPMGTDFVLANFTVERGLRVLPLFNNVNLAYLRIKAEAFLDTGKTFDRARVFRQDKTLVDIGLGLKFETPAHVIHLIAGRSLRDGRGTFKAYVEKRWW